MITRYQRRLLKRAKKGVEPGLYELVTGKITYGVCKCELGCKCPEAN